MTFTSAEATVGSLEEIGMALSIPEGALSSTDEPLGVQIRPCINCPLSLPDGYVPASPVYFIECEKAVKFRKKCTLEILHYMHLDALHDGRAMAFMTSTKYRGPDTTYHFARVKEGNQIFQLSSNKGTIFLDHFCAILIAREQDHREQGGTYAYDILHA